MPGCSVVVSLRERDHDVTAWKDPLVSPRPAAQFQDAGLNHGMGLALEGLTQNFVAGFERLRGQFVQEAHSVLWALLTLDHHFRQLEPHEVGTPLEPPQVFLQQRNGLVFHTITTHPISVSQQIGFRKLPSR